MPGATWWDFTATFGAFYAWAAPTGKPLLAWAAVLEKPPEPQWKADWMTGVSTTLQTTMPAVQAFVYYHALSPGGHLFWADTTPQALAAYETVGCLPYFHTGGGACTPSSRTGGR